jgi:RNA polymerase sigma-70 factor (ECF subfamily)
MKIGVNYTITQLRRKRWKDVSLDNLKSPDTMISPGKLIRFFDGPEKRMMKREMIGMMNQIIADELTDQQRKVMEAVMIHGMPLDEVASRLNTNRNALYKAMHDARKHLKKILIERGMDKDEILDIFS